MINDRMVEVPDPNTRAVVEQLHKPTRPPATYQEHMTRVEPGGDGGSNYHIGCSCGWAVRLASRSDVEAATLAYDHVHTAQPPSVEALFDRL